MVFIQKETNMLNPDLKEGDRILLIHMDGESSVSIGDKGTVKRNSRDPFEKDDTIYSVEWDNGTTLNLLSATDSWIYDKDFKPKGSIKKGKEIKEGSVEEVDEYMKLKDIFKSGKKKKIFDFFESIRTSGIVNMFESSRFIYSGGEYLKDYVKMQKYSGYEFDEDTIDNLADLADDAKNEMISITMEVLESEGIELTLDNMNRHIKKLSNEALRFFNQNLINVNTVSRYSHQKDGTSTQIYLIF